MAKRTRKIIEIDEERCDGCGLCVPSCAEGAIQIIDGKAKLVAENLCDGIGNCLGTCPEDAIRVIERDAEDFDPTAVARHLGTPSAPPVPRTRVPASISFADPQASSADGCPGVRLRTMRPVSTRPAPGDGTPTSTSQLRQWPVQLTLLPRRGAIWEDAEVLIAADCVPVAVPDFHQRFLIGQTLAIACPKLDEVAPYVEKLTDIFAHHKIRKLTVVKMEVPCCGSLVTLVQAALQRANVDLPVEVLTVGINGAAQSRLVRQSGDGAARGAMMAPGFDAVGQ